ncbi:MAG: transcriptional regulator, partial [Nitrosopumilaceae archaeon]
VLDEPKIISEILEVTQIPQTSGYRKINSLIDNGLLIVQGHVTTYDGKMVNKYKSTFDNVTINIEKNKVIVKVLLAKESIEKSSILQVIRYR